PRSRSSDRGQRSGRTAGKRLSVKQVETPLWRPLSGINTRTTRPAAWGNSALRTGVQELVVVVRSVATGWGEKEDVRGVRPLHTPSAICSFGIASRGSLSARQRPLQCRWYLLSVHGAPS